MKNGFPGKLEKDNPIQKTIKYKTHWGQVL